MLKSSPSLLVIETHPVQYRVPVYRALQANWGVKVHAIYGSDFSLSGYFDEHFKTQCSWDVDLLNGIERSQFLAHKSQGGASSMNEISARGMAQAVRKAKADAVLLTGYSPIFHLHGLYHSLSLKRPILFRAETTESYANDTMKRRLRDIFLRRLYSKCARLLPIGKQSREHYRRLGCDDEKLVLSPYCVDTKPFQCDEAARRDLRSAARTELGIATDSLVLLLSGKIYEHKRPLLLLEAIRLLPEQVRSKVHVLCLGSGPDLEAVQAAAAREPAIRLSCTGFQSQSQLSPWYHASDLLVMPSKSETWGLVVNEALHHGVPCVVTSKVGSGPDLVHSGVTGEIAPGTATEIAAGIMKALPLVGDLKVRLQCRSVVSDYTVDKAAEGLFRAFQQTTQTVFSESQQRVVTGAARQ